MLFDGEIGRKFFFNAVSLLLLFALPGPVGSSSGRETALVEKDRTAQSGAGGGKGAKIPFPRPESHGANWLEYHGASADVDVNGAGRRGQSCFVCHERNDCIDCHNTRLPRDHTNTWRTLSHGFMAAGNRERCLTCHRQDYCVRCHNETAPRTHAGNWNTGSNPRHCSWCHFDGGVVPADNCVVCHKQAPHTSAPPIPHPPIGAQTTCIQFGCHQ